MHIVSVQVGTPRTVGTPGAADPLHRAFTSAIWKESVAGPVWAGSLGLRGDAVANTKVHGGPDQAVLMYAASHYPLWAAEWRRELAHGAFGENLTVEGLTEHEVCIGDVLVAGAARFQVSQPREPCSTLGRRHQIRDMIAIVQANGRGGWYLRVLEEGEVRAGQPLAIAERLNPEWSVRRASLAMRHRKTDPADAAELARCSGLSPGWRQRLEAVG
ncbi:MAG: MOSC domain-containing protein [Gemmatimonadales bacterium]